MTSRSKYSSQRFDVALFTVSRVMCPWMYMSSWRIYCDSSSCPFLVNISEDNYESEEEEENLGQPEPVIAGTAHSVTMPDNSTSQLQLNVIPSNVVAQSTVSNSDMNSIHSNSLPSSNVMNHNVSGSVLYVLFL